MSEQNRREQEPNGGEMSEAEIRSKVEAEAKEQDLSKEQVEKFVKVLSAWQSPELPSDIILVEKDGKQEHLDPKKLAESFGDHCKKYSNLGPDATVDMRVAEDEGKIKNFIEDRKNLDPEILARKIEVFKNKLPSHMAEKIKDGGDTNNLFCDFFTDVLQINEKREIFIKGLLYSHYYRPFLVNSKTNGGWRDAINRRLSDVVHVLKVVDDYRASHDNGSDPLSDEGLNKTLGQIVIELYEKYGIPPYMLTA